MKQTNLIGINSAKQTGLLRRKELKNGEMEMEKRDTLTYDDDFPELSSTDDASSDAGERAPDSERGDIGKYNSATEAQIERQNAMEHLESKEYAVRNPVDAKSMPHIASYLKQIGRVPLLKRDEEKALFGALQMQKMRLKEFLRQLQRSNLLESDQSKHLQQIFTSKRRRPNEALISLSPDTLGKLHNLITEWRTNIAATVSSIQNESNTTAADNINTDTRKTPPILELETLFAELHVTVTQIQDIQRQLVEANLLLVASIAKQYWFREFPLSFLDLMQEGSIGLMTAIHKFRLDKGHRFSTYATWWISQAIRRALDEQSQLIRIPSSIAEVRRRAVQETAKLEKDLDREPTLNELAEVLDIAPSRLREILGAPKELLSLDTPIGESNSKITIADLIIDETAKTPEEIIASQSRDDAVDHLLSTLSERQSCVIKMRFGLQDGNLYTLSQIGKHLGVSRERVRQIEEEALAKLRHPSRLPYWQELFD